MSFGFGAGGGFGQQNQSSPFGQASPFGGQQQQQQQQPAAAPFGQQAGSPFGGGTGGFGAAATPAFGAASTPAFGAASTPAFGAASTPSFGSTAFGAKPTGFGFGAAGGGSPFGGGSAAQQPAFGAAASTPAFGAQAASTPAFGAAAAAPAFGAAPSAGGFGGFGATTTPAFGAQAASSTPAFGAAASTTPAFGSAAPAFGAGASGSGSPFGAAPAGPGAAGAGGGSRVAAYQKHQEHDTSTTGVKQTVFFMSISAMPPYQAKSHEELRWEDYQAGVTHAGAAPQGQQQPAAAGGAFGQQPAGGAFGQQQQPFGSAGAQTSTGGAFGAAATPAFGGFGAQQQPQQQQQAGGFGFGGSTPAFGGGAFGAASTPAFGAQASTPAFGSTPTPAFGSQQPAFGAQASTPAFGAQASTPAFGAASTPAFGFSAAPSTPTFGAAASTPAFGAAPASTPSLFGGQASTPAFGAQATSTPAFGAAPAGGAGGGFSFASSTPAFGAAGSSPAFGAAQPAFGATSPQPAFGAAGSTPSFSAAGGGGLFGASQPRPAAPGGFGAAPGGGAFSFSGGATTPAFGANTGGGLFGASSTPAYGATQPAAGGGLFGAQQPSAAGGGGLFNFAGGGVAGGGTAGAYGAAQPAQAPGVATSPYGVLPEPPRIASSAAVPEYRVGLSLRPAGGAGLAGSPRPTSLITPRSITPASSMRVRARRSRGDVGRSALARAASGEMSSASLFGGGGVSNGTPGKGEDGGVGTPGSGAGIFVVRDNPRRLFIRDPLPSPQDAAASSPAPSRGGANGGGGTPLQRATPSATREDGGYAGARGLEPYSNGRPGKQQQQLPAGGEEPHVNGRRSGAGVEEDGGGNLSNEQLSRLLPSLSREAEAAGYYCEPPLRQLAAMARCEGGGALRGVAGFVVGRRGFGSVRWLEPVDVRRLDLDDIVRIGRGTVEVYLNEAVKPEVGKGLNRPAVVTMHKVFRTDKATGQPATDPDSVARFTRKLKRVAASQAARFVSYDPKEGTWCFEVEHFSKYGLTGDDSDDDEEELGDGDASEWVEVSVGRPLGLAGDDEDDEDDEDYDEEGDEEAHMRAAEGEEGMDVESDAGGSASRFGGGLLGARSLDGGSPNSMAAHPLAQQQPAAGSGMPGASPLLQVALPAALALDPQELAEARDSLFPQAGAAATGGAAAAHAHYPPQQQHRRQQAATEQRPASAAQVAPAVQQALLMGGPGVWRMPAAPVLSAARTVGVAAGGGAGGPATAAAGAGWPALGGSQCLVSVAGGQQQVDSQAAGGMVDAGLMLGRSFRVGWGPNNQLAMPAGVAAPRGSTPASEVAIKRITVGAMAAVAGSSSSSGPARGKGAGVVASAAEAHVPLLLAPASVLAAGGGHGASGGPPSAAAAHAQAAATTDRWRTALRLHLRHSRPVGADERGGDGSGEAFAGGPAADGAARASAEAGGGVPRWSFVCGRGSELEEVTTRYVEQAAEHLRKHQPHLSAIRQLATRHEAETWELVRVLFAAVPGEEEEGDGEETDRDEGDGMEDEEAAAEDVGMEGGEGDDVGRGQRRSRGSQWRLVQLRRWSFLSQWLRDRAKPLVEGSLQAAADHSRGWLLLQLLSGHQLAAAAGVSAAGGDVRLATLLSQAGRSQQVLECAAQQLQVWQGARFEQFIDRERMAVYQLLAGNLEPSVSTLPLDWRRALGMHLWYGHPAGTPPEAALASFWSAAEAGAAPPPQPPYAERLGVATAPRVWDTAFHLLRLACQPGKAHDARFLAELLRPQGYSPEPLDALPGWQLSTVLQAIGALPGGGGRGGVARRGGQVQEEGEEEGAAAPEEVFALHMDVVAQLACLPGMAEWHVYVALHLPDDGPGRWAGGLRGAAVRELLYRSAAEWAADRRKTAFLRDVLRLPREWLAGAMATWAKYNHDHEGELRHLLDAGAWRQAHSLLAADVGPRLFLSKRHDALRTLVNRLEAHSGQVDTAGVPGGWQHGGGLYLLYYTLLARYEQQAAQQKVGAGRAGGAPPPLQECARLRDVLAEAARRYSGRLHAATFSAMSADLARWVLAQPLAHAAEEQQERPQEAPAAAAALQGQLLAASLELCSQRGRLSALQLAAATLFAAQ